MLSDGERILLGHVGDSRAYRYRDGRLGQISRDHTYVQTLVDSGLVTREELAFHPWRNVVLRSFQASPDAELTDVDIVEVDARPGDRLLLCSDGLTDMVGDERIAEVLRLKDPHSAAAVLTHAALESGGHDNITCVVVDVIDGPLVVGDGRLLGAVSDPENIVDPAVVPPRPDSRGFLRNAVSLVFTRPHLSQWGHNYTRVTWTLLAPTRPLGKAYLDAGEEGGPR